METNIPDRMAEIAQKAEAKRATKAKAQQPTEQTVTTTEPQVTTSQVAAQAEPVSSAPQLATETQEAAETSAAQETKATIKEPQKGKKPKVEKFWEKAAETTTTETAQTQTQATPSKEYEDWKKKAEQWDALQNDISYVALQRARAEGKDLLTLANELSSQDPSKLKREDVFKLILNEVGYTDQDEIESEIDEFKSKKPYEQEQIIERKRQKLIDDYNNNLNKFRAEYTPKEVQEQNNLKDFHKALEESKGKSDFGGALTYDQAALDKAMQAVEKATPQETLRAFALLGNLDVVFKNVYEAGMNEVLSNEINELRGTTERGIKTTPVIEKDKSNKAVAKRLVNEIRGQHQALGLKTASINTQQ